MDALIRDLLDLLLRWVHLIAGIMWIGNSMLFNWLDRNLVKKTGAGELVEGEIWLLHSGAFYEVEKKLLAPKEMPKVLHWFKWQAGITWLSGAFLLVVVYYVGSGGVLLTDPSVLAISHGAAAAIGVGVLVVGWGLYDLLWSRLGPAHPRLANAVSLLLLGGAAFGLTRVFSGRAAYLHVGALLGTLMAGNVWMRILPAQRELVAATKDGRPQDKRFSLRAKQRSIHNNYMTFPLLFIMVSNHFPGTYGHALNWAILAVLMIGGAGVRHIMNIRFGCARVSQWVGPLAATVAVSVALLAFLMTRAPKAAARIATPGDHVSFTAVRLIVDQRCRPCHATRPTEPSLLAAPNGIVFETPEQIRAQAERIKFRAVLSKTMPLANKTGMTDEERDLLGRWILSGAHID